MKALFINGPKDGQTMDVPGAVGCTWIKIPISIKRDDGIRYIKIAVYELMKASYLYGEYDFRFYEQ